MKRSIPRDHKRALQVIWMGATTQSRISRSRMRHLWATPNDVALMSDPLRNVTFVIRVVRNRFYRANGDNNLPWKPKQVHFIHPFLFTAHAHPAARRAVLEAMPPEWKAWVIGDILFEGKGS